MIEKLAWAIYNDIVSGLAGITSTPTISIDQLFDDVKDERLQIIKEYSLKNLIPKKDLLATIDCIELDCKALDKCPCATSGLTTPELHFEIPQIINDFAEEAIEYIGSIDRKNKYRVYTSITGFQYHKFKRRGSDKPYVYVETTPNVNNLYDCWLFNAPFTKKISVIGIFKDPRQLVNYECCAEEPLDNFSFLATEIKKRLTEKKLRYYRQFLANPHPNDQVPR